MPVVSLVLEVRLPGARSLKEKRSVVRSVVESCRTRFRVAAAETGDQDLHQRAVLEFAAVAGERAHAEAVLDEVERLVWSRTELEVVSSRRAWTEDEG